MPQPFRDLEHDFVPTQKPLPPKGLQTARIWYVVDLGTQNVEYIDPGTKKASISTKPLIKLGFELPACLMPPEEGKPNDRPFSLWKEFTWSMNFKGKFGPFCQAIYGPRFEIIQESHRGRPVRLGLLDGQDLKLADLLGVVCKVSIIHTKSVKNGLTYANAANFSEFPEPQPGDPLRFQYPPAINPPKYFDLDQFKSQEFDALYKWDQDKICQSKEWEKRSLGSTQPATAAPEDEDPYAGQPKSDDDIPFN